MNFAKRLKSLREENDIKQVELAKYLKVTSATLSQYEKGVREPNNETLIKLADYFDVSIDYLLGRTIARNHVDTIAFHSLDDDDLTEEGKEELAKLKELVKLKYGKKKD